MADRGYRSVEVTITNDTRGDLTIQAAGDLPDSGNRIQGEKPTPSSVLKQYSSMLFGVATDDQNGAATAILELTGFGSSPIQISFFNQPDGTSNCSVTPNNAVQAKTTQVDTGEQNHTQFQIQLVPAPPSPHVS